MKIIGNVLIVEDTDWNEIEENDNLNALWEIRRVAYYNGLDFDEWVRKWGRNAQFSFEAQDHSKYVYFV